MHRHKHYVREETKACIFTLCLVIFSLSCIATAFMESGPIILGTERNGNGTVEYLCLGTGCENLRPLDW